MKRKLIFAGAFLIIILAAIAGLVVRNSNQGGVKTYEKDGELYYDYVSDGEHGYAITVNVNNKKELSRTQILEYMQEIRMTGRGYDYKEQSYWKYNFFLPQDITNYYFDDNTQSITYTLQNATGRMSLTDSEDEEVNIARFDTIKHISNDSVEYNNPEKYLCIEQYITSQKTDTGAGNNSKDKIKEAISNMIIRADVKHKDGTSDRHYIKFELINEYVDRFVYVYELQME